MRASVATSALFLAISAVYANTELKPDLANVPTNQKPVPPGVFNRPPRNPNSPDACVDGLCHPTKRCVASRGQPDGLCVKDPHAPTCYALNQPCIDISDCCPGADVCAPPLSNPDGQPICREDPCANDKTLITRNWASIQTFGSVHIDLLGQLDDLACCRSCQATPDCDFWLNSFSTCALLVADSGRVPPTSDTCPNGLSPQNILSKIDGDQYHAGKGPCLDLSTFSVQSV